MFFLKTFAKSVNKEDPVSDDDDDMSEGILLPADYYPGDPIPKSILGDAIAASCKTKIKCKIFRCRVKVICT